MGVTLRMPGSEKTIEVSDDEVAAWRARGFREISSPSTPAPEQGAASAQSEPAPEPERAAAPLTAQVTTTAKAKKKPGRKTARSRADSLNTENEE